MLVVIPNTVKRIDDASGTRFEYTPVDAIVCVEEIVQIVPFDRNIKKIKMRFAPPVYTEAHWGVLCERCGVVSHE